MIAEILEDLAVLTEVEKAVLVFAVPFVFGPMLVLLRFLKPGR